MAKQHNDDRIKHATTAVTTKNLDLKAITKLSGGKVKSHT
jgi:ABC-type Mn2+/Zn2+ transport system ATPase subunit